MPQKSAFSMSNEEAARLLVHMCGLLSKEGYSDDKYTQAVSLAIGYLLIDDVLDRRAPPSVSVDVLDVI